MPVSCRRSGGDNVGPFAVNYRARLFLIFFLAPPGQQIGQKFEPRYLCPRLHVLQPPRFTLGMAFLFYDFDFPSAPSIPSL